MVVLDKRVGGHNHEADAQLKGIVEPLDIKVRNAKSLCRRSVLLEHHERREYNVVPAKRFGSCNVAH